MFTVARGDSIRQAMEKITRNIHRVVVVLDGRRVVGTVSDGDIRRALLREVMLIAPVEKIMNVNCRVTRESDPVRQREALLREKTTVLPVVDPAGDLVDVVLAYEPSFGSADAEE